MFEKQGFEKIKDNIEESVKKMFNTGGMGGSMNQEQYAELQGNLHNILNAITGLG